MRSNWLKVLVAVSLSAILAAPARSHAWGNSGHEAVAYVAWQQLTPATRARVLELLKLVPTLHNPENTASIPGFTDWVNDLPPGLTDDQKNLYLFMRAATWADSIKHQWLKDSDTPPANRPVEVNIGYTDTESHGYWHFINTAFASDQSKVPATPAPNVATQIIALRQDIASDEDDVLKSYDMVWLLHLVGDIHQPLHGAVRYYAGTGDQGGNLVKIDLTPAMKKQFEGSLSSSAPTELHAFWDDLPGEGEPAPALPQAAAFAGSLPSAAAGQIADIDPAGWASESLALAKSDAYSAPIGNGPQPAASKSKKSPSAYLISSTYYSTAMQDAKVRIALAGARLAKLLNENLK
jgi:S1/P1 Nuclease